MSIEITKYVPLKPLNIYLFIEMLKKWMECISVITYILFILFKFGGLN